MTPQEEIDLLTRTGRGTPCGELMRRYWQPAALSDALGPDKRIAVQLFGEELVLFRDAAGQAALIGRWCAHQGVDMIYGRVEPDGIRCMYHGWLFDACGRVIVRGEWVEGGEKRMEVGQPAYPCREAAGIIFAYMGSGEPPPMPAYDFLGLPAENLVVTRATLNLKYLHACENNIERLRAAASGEQIDVDVEVGRYSLRLYRTRPAGSDQKRPMVTEFMCPNVVACAAEVPVDGYSVRWHVPIDDRSHNQYTLCFDRNGALSEELRRRIQDNVGKTDRSNSDHQSSSSAHEMEDEREATLDGDPELVCSSAAAVAARKLLLDAIQAMHQGCDLRQTLILLP